MAWLQWSMSVLLSQPVEPTDAPRIPGDYVLRWEAPAECPTADEVRAMVLARHGATTPGGEAAEIDAVVTGSARGGYALQLSTRFGGDTHVRKMQAPACIDLADGTAIVIAVALAHGVELAMTPSPAEVPLVPPVEDPPPEPSPDPSKDSPEEPTREVAYVMPPLARQVPEPPRRRPPRAALRIAGGGEIGALGAVTAAAQLGIAAVWPRARAEVHGIYLVPRTRIDAATNARATFQGGAVSARGCWVPPVRAVEIPLCGGFEAGTIRVATPFAAQAVRHTPWAGPLVGVGVLRDVGPVRLVLAVDAAVRVVGSRFRIDGRWTFTQLPVSVRWLLGLEFRLGQEKTSAGQKNSRGRGH